MNKREIISAFEKRTLPKSGWTHQAHLIVALWHCIRHNSETALTLLREKIKSYNEAVGTANSDNEGYHETLTRFWIWQTAQFLAECKSNDFVTICNAFIASEQGDKNAPFRYYSKERLFSTEARLNWIEPDLKPMKTENKKYMIIEHFHPDKIIELYTRFDKKGRMFPEGVQYIDSWIDEEVRVCYQLMESRSKIKLQEWISQWDDLADFEIVLVLSSQEAKRKVFLPNI